MKTILKFFIGTGALVLITGFIYRYLLKRSGLTVTSWWRTPWHNRKVGGNIFSLHQIGLGFDIVPVNDATRKKLESLPLPLKKIIKESDHYHVQVL